MNEQNGRWFLTGIGGAVNGREFVLMGNHIRLGRSRDNDVVLSGNNISRHHSAIVFRDSGYWIQDLKSKNGTFLNEKTIEESPLVENDILRIGDCRLRVGMEPTTKEEVLPQLKKKDVARHLIAQLSAQLANLQASCKTIIAWLAKKPPKQQIIYLGSLATFLILLVIGLRGLRNRIGSSNHPSVAPQAATSHSLNEPAISATEEEVSLWKSRAQSALTANDLPLAVTYFRKTLSARPNEEALRLKLTRTEARLRNEIQKHCARGVQEFEKLYYEKAISEWQKVILLSENFDLDSSKVATQRIKDAITKMKSQRR